MGKEEIIERILSDAEAEAREIVAKAEKEAAERAARAEADAAELRAEVEAEVGERSRRISEGKAAAARLENAKIMLAEKRRVLDELYESALVRLLALKEREQLALLSRLLEETAEEGDEVLFAEDFPYAAQAAKLPVVSARKLSVSAQRARVKGGFVLRGKLCDKDVSYEALLRADREEHQAELAARLFI